MRGLILALLTAKALVSGIEIRCDVPVAGNVNLMVFDERNRVVKELSDGIRPAGEYRWRLKLKKGKYKVLLRIGRETEMKKIEVK